MAKKTNTNINGNLYYRVTRTIGHDASGKPIKKQFYGSGINEANEKANAFMSELKLGLRSDRGVVTINSLFPSWLFDNKSNTIKRSTLETYEGLYRNYIKTSFIATQPLGELRSVHIQKFYKKLSETKAVHSDKNVSIARIKSIHKLLHLFFAYCVNEGYLLRNPCTNVTIPKEKLDPNKVMAKKLKFDYFTVDELGLILQAFQDSSYLPIIVMAIGTGMRQGEILGLQWEDVDFENRSIHVIHNLCNSCDFDEAGNRFYSLQLTTPKSANAVRTIPMSDTIFNLLSGLEQTNTMVFPSKQNTYINSKNLLKVWQQKLKTLGIRYRKFHDLRHTFATLLLANRC